MKRLLSVFLSLTMMATIFSANVFAYELGEDLKPSFTVNVEQVVTSTNKALVAVSLNTIEDLDYVANTEYNPETFEEETTYSGKSAITVDLEINLNSQYFDITGATFPTNFKYISTDSTVINADNNLAYVHNNGVTGGIVGNGVVLFKALVSLKDTYTAEQLNAANFYTLVAAKVTIAEWAEGTKDPNAISKSANYSSNIGTADYDIVLETEPEPDETIKIDETVKENATAGTRTYKVTVGADLKDEGVTAVLTHDDHPDDPQEIGLTFTDWAGEAQAVFDVVVTFLNYTANASKVSLSIIK